LVRAATFVVANFSGPREEERRTIFEREDRKKERIGETKERSRESRGIRALERMRDNICGVNSEREQDALTKIADKFPLSFFSPSFPQ